MSKNPIVKANEDTVPPFDYQIIQSIRLPRAITPLPVSFDKVIEARTSSRQFNTLTLQQIGDLLWYTAKVKTLFQQENGYILTHRGTPSAGARHPIDILISGSSLPVGDQFYYYNPFEHSLNQLANSQNSLKNFFDHVNEIVTINEATLIWFVAHPNRTSTKYENAASLIWRDAGALISNIQLTTTAMGLNSCPIGSLGEPYISNFFNAQGAVFGTGGVLIG